MKVNEIFYSIQGESTYAGLPCVFIRLSGCNLRCSYCDSSYAYQEGEEISIDEVIESVRNFSCRLVEITGGEPLLQEDCFALIERLLDLYFIVLCETNGSLDVSKLDTRCVKILDLKCPGSGESEKNLWSNLHCLSHRDEVKFVISDEADYQWAKAIIDERRLTKALLSPVHGKVSPADLASWMLRDRIGARLQLQLHKMIWDPNARGV